MNGSNSLSLEALAASQLMAALSDAGEDDAEVVENTIDGECGFNEAVDAALAELDLLEGMVEGIHRQQQRLHARQVRLTQKQDRIKAQLLAAIEVAGVPTPLRRPMATVSVTKGRAKVVVTDEAAIPAGYWREKVTRTPDLKLLAEVLEVEGHVPGACMSNACPSLVVRVR